MYNYVYIYRERSIIFNFRQKCLIFYRFHPKKNIQPNRFFVVQGSQSLGNSWIKGSMTLTQTSTKGPKSSMGMP